ncbi:MAG TPA: nodulation protein NfeD [Burkholderiaceae bacterium]|nr:nodulation protein NfeD [Burkholderiaceae bacterium]
MRKLFNLVLLACCGLFLPGASAVSPPVLVLPLTGAIGPASADFLTRGIARAQQDGAQLLVLQMDTPGGLDLSMRDIIKAILASPVPVAAFVAPSGARAASAGTYILYASHIAAMAPGTNLGAATPVQIGLSGTPDEGKKPAQGAASTDGKNAPDNQPGALERKQMHDAAAYIRGLAQLRGRNAEWAERAVREAVSLSADEALAQNVIELTATDVPALLTALDGRRLRTVSGEHVLHTRGATIVRIEPDWKTRLLSVITDPGIALLLLMAGVYGLFFEFASPGFVLPGVVGAICLLLGMFALHLLPVNYAGLALILLGLSFMVAEVFLTSFGVLAVGGMIAFAVGALMLVDTDLPGYGVPLGLVAAVSVFSAGFIFMVASLALKARRRPVVSGQEALLGSIGEALSDLPAGGGQGWGRVQGEQWEIRSAVPLRRGQRLRVVARDGLVLSVEAADDVNSRRQGE